MATHSHSSTELPPPFRPDTVAFFDLDGQIGGDGIYADIRRYGWDHAVDGLFHSSVFAINFNLKPRTAGYLTMRPVSQRGYRKPGNIVFIPAGETFAAHCEPGELHDLCVTLEPQRAELLLDTHTNLRELDPCMDVRNRRIQQCLMRLAEEVAKPGFASEIVAESLTVLLMIEMYRHLSACKTIEAEPSGKMVDWRLRRVLERVHDTMEKPLSLAEFAAEFGISSRHLVRTFKNTMGVTFSEYVADVRMQRARELLARGDVLIKEVAFSCGFRSAAAFSAAFHAATGHTPREYQQRHNGVVAPPAGKFKTSSNDE